MTHHLRFQRALATLQGLAIGDAFGQLFTWYDPTELPRQLKAREIPDEPWEYSDDTMMALSIVEILGKYGYIEQNALAASFAEHYEEGRGYGPAMHSLLTEINAGAAWRSAAPALFDGQGSYGNGAAMRVAPLGCYFADDLTQVCEQAALSAVVTHCHPEAVAGAIAVAIAAALAVAAADAGQPITRAEFLSQILAYLPDSEVRSGVILAQQLPTGISVRDAVAQLGNGGHITAQDTVPLALWCAAGSLQQFDTALWNTLSALGDIDTNCAIVGGIVAAGTGIAGIPRAWLDECEPIPKWVWPPGETPHRA